MENDLKSFTFYTCRCYINFFQGNLPHTQYYLNGCDADIIHTK